jgi:acetyl esterase/lipase
MSERDLGRVTIEEGVVFGSGGGRELRCDVFTPPGEVRNAPAVLLVHGGGWRQGDRSQLRGYGVLLGREGYVCVASEYRLVQESPWPAQIDDVKTAIRWMRSNATKLGIDPTKIAIEGNSAGAHLALMAAGDPSEGTEVAAAIGVYAPTLLAHQAGTRGAVPLIALVDGGGTEEVAKAASPFSFVGPNFPPTMLVHGSADELVPLDASLVMYEALVAAGVPTEMHLYAEQPHAFDAQPEFGRQVAVEMLLFLNRYVRDRSASSVKQPAAAST